MLIYLVLAEVILVVIVELLKFIYSVVNLGLCAFEDDYAFGFLYLWRSSFIFLLNQFLNIWLLPEDSLELFRFFVEAENAANPVVLMGYVLLFPSWVLIDSSLTCSVDIVIKSSLYLVLVASDSLFLPIKVVFYALLVVLFNLPVLIWVVEDAVKMGKLSRFVIGVVCINFVSPPAFKVKNCRLRLE